MATQRDARIPRMTADAVLVAVAVLSVVAAAAQAPNRPSTPVDLPNGPAKPGFDISRFSEAGNGWFETFYVNESHPLRDALRAGKIAEDTRLLVTDTAGGRLALLTDQMAFHHLAQGSAGGTDWLVSFWVVCNTGTRLVPTINGKMHHFNNVGLYDGLFVMQDTETKTLWNHITGEALYGPLVGRTLGPLGNVLQMTVKQALAMDANMQVAISDRSYFAGGRQFGTAAGLGAGRGPGRQGPGAPRLNPNATLSPMFIETLGQEDQRRPRMDMGLGVWTTTTRRYYPVDRIRERDNAFVDQIDGRKVLVYIDPETSTPAALFVNSTNARLQDNEVRLDNGQVVRSGVLFDARGQRQSPERPQQVFTRWYGFALTFPGTEVFGP